MVKATACGKEENAMTPQYFNEDQLQAIELIDIENFNPRLEQQLSEPGNGGPVECAMLILQEEIEKEALAAEILIPEDVYRANDFDTLMMRLIEVRKLRT